MGTARSQGGLARPVDGVITEKDMLDLAKHIVNQKAGRFD
jgi:non-homologous end joining protein Ku